MLKRCPLKTKVVATVLLSAVYSIGVYSKRNLCFFAGRSASLSCLNLVFSIPSVFTKSTLSPRMPRPSLEMTMSGVGFQNVPAASKVYLSPVARLSFGRTRYCACAGTAHDRPANRVRVAARIRVRIIWIILPRGG